METLASFEARSAPSSYPTASESSLFWILSLTALSGSIQFEFAPQELLRDFEGLDT